MCTGSTHLLGFQPKVKAFALRPAAVTQHTTAFCSTQVVDMIFMEHRSTIITSLRMAQQKHMRVHNHTHIITNHNIQQFTYPQESFEDIA